MSDRPARSIKKYGWTPDLPDQRDLFLKVPPALPLPPMVDLRPQCPPIQDQGDLGSCVSNAVAAACDFSRLREKKTLYNPSRLFIYYNGRVIEDTVGFDSGMQIRDGIKAIARWGFCSEKSWPYNIPKFTRKPPDIKYTEGKREIVKQYSRVPQTALSLKTSLFKGIPIVFGFTVYESFESTATSKTGIVTLPGLREQVIGGHAVMLVGYDDSKSMFIVRNSWGTNWGLRGYFLMPYSYILSPELADDFWSVLYVP